MTTHAFSFRSTPSGHVIAQEVESNDLIVFDPSGKELIRHQGSAEFMHGTVNTNQTPLIEMPTRQQRLISLFGSVATTTSS